jgi:hypothetical protein
MSDIFKLSDRIQFLPVVHGSGSFTREIRHRILSSGCDCMAVCLPPEFRSTVEEGIENLPTIGVSCLDESDDTISYVPIDPCQPVIMGLRMAMQEGISRHYIDLSVPNYKPRRFSFPDPFALQSLSFEKFCLSVLPAIKRPDKNSQHDKRARWMAYQLHKLEMDHKKILFICSLLDWPWIKDAYNERLKYPKVEKSSNHPNLYSVDKSTLFFALSEFPYVTYLYEKNRQELRADKDVTIDGIKEILLKARDNYLKKIKIKNHNLSSQSFQILLQYVRNLTLMESRLAPDLYTLTLTAKQIGGDLLAVSLIEAARDYPFQEEDDVNESMALGIDKGMIDEENVMNMKNRLSETDGEWRTLDLKPSPDKWKKQKWKFTWDPYGQCSWPPEDEKIENLNSRIREQTKLLLSNDLARTEKFTSSVKDGIDMRDTLRNWHTGDIYVKEVPPSRGTVEIVVFLFEMEPDPDHYTWLQTWYAEHQNESTLCFYATDYMSDMVGPGIGQAHYGGCMMIYPPRPIINIWQDPRLQMGKTLEEKLLEAAFLHSREKHITVVSPGPPTINWRKMAKKYQKRIIHIPIKKFSNQTIEKVRRFHVLNGKEIRSFAQRFIQDL